MKNLLLTTVMASLLMFASTACNTTESSPELSDAESTDTTQADLLIYDGPAESIPVTAQYPNTMEVMVGSGAEGVSVRFTFNPQGNALDDAEVSVVLWAGMTSTSDLNIDGPNGLIENNGWYLDNTRADPASEFPYPWVEMVFEISTDMGQTGHILIGQSNGQAVQAIVLYPAEMADEFWPSTRTVLDSLKFDADLLPIPRSLVYLSFAQINGNML